MESLLLVEDNEDHAELTTDALKRTGLINQVVVARDGYEAFDYLHSRGRFKNKKQNPPPGLIVLDLKLPRMEGFEFLKSLRRMRPWRITPVVILTTSSNPEDIHKALELGANDYIIKPADFKAFTAKLKGLAEYWVNVSDIAK